MKYGKLSVMGVDGDSITAGEQWTKYACKILGISECVNAAVGSAVWYKRRAEVKGMRLETQSFSDADFAGISDGWTPTDDASEIQMRLNNCAIIHIEKYLKEVKAAPDVFVFAMGTNDEEKYLGNIESDDVFTTVGAMKWCMGKIKDAFPKCKIFLSLPIQSADVLHNAKNKRCIPLMCAVAELFDAYVIDCHMSCGIHCVEECVGKEGKNLIDGLHPKESGRELMGKYIAAQIQDVIDFENNTNRSENMSKVKFVNVPPLKNIPWQEGPADFKGAPIWRYDKNPIIGRNPVKGVARIFNSAVQPYEDGFIGVFRGEQCNGISFIYLGRSKNGIDWEFEEEKIRFTNENGEPFMPNYAYDPRLVKVEDTYYIIWCTDFYGAAIGMAKTTDFKTFTRIENPFLPFNRNAVLFPRKINGNFVMLSRPSDSGHTPFGDIFISESPDLTYWGKHRHVMGKGKEWWEALKIGGGAAPIETTEGWLMFYHGVTGTCNGYVYSIGGAILDINDPSVVKYRCENFLLTPEAEYEERGFVPNVCFPCATLQDADTGRIAIYYGAADSYVAVAFTKLDLIVDYIKEHSVLTEQDTEIGIR